MNPNPLHEAYMHFNAGRLEAADEGCREVLSAEANHSEANHLLGIIRYQQGRTSEACELLLRAAASPLARPEMHNNLGAVLNSLGRTEEAAAAFERALAINPNYADALNNLGVIYRDAKKIEQAIDAFRRAVALRPDLPQVKANLRSAYRDVVPAWHFAMMDDAKRNGAYEAAIRRAVPGKRVLDIGTGAGLLAMMAARAGAAHVTTCEAVGIIAERAREIVERNGLADRITVIAKPSTELVAGRDIPERAEVLVTETFASGLINEGILPTVEHAHEHLLTPGATIIPAAASVMGYLVGGTTLKGMLFAGEIAGFDLSQFNDFAPPTLFANLDSVPHLALSGDVELMRFDLREARFPMGNARLVLKAIRDADCIGIAQWIRLDLDAETRYENRPAPAAAYNGHWGHVVHRFPKILPVNAKDSVPVIARHDRMRIGFDLVE